VRLVPSEIFAGRSVFLLGGTGFLGKVCLGLLLDRFPAIRRIYLMVRPRTGGTSADRFWEEVLPSPAFDPLRQRYGTALEPCLREKLIIVGGDITLANLGYSEEEADAIAADIDVLVNCSGRVTFNPPLESALKTNVTGTLNTLAFAHRMKRPALVHVSTCFVAGNRSGEIWENEPVIGYFPRRDEPDAPDFSVEQEIADCEKLAARVREEAEDRALSARFRDEAIKRFIEEGRDPDNERALRPAIARERKNWIRLRLTRLGIERAQWWGWPNIYTYTKSLGEQLVAAETSVVRAIVRPSVVESAVEFPFPGWNEGFTTTAPLVHLALKGQNLFPLKDQLILDVIPVDYAAAAVLGVAAQCCVEEPALVHQLSSGDLNPARLGRLVTLLGLYKRRHFQEKTTGSRLLNEIAARMEAQPVSPERFEQFSLPMLHRATRRVSEILERVHSRGFGPMAGLVERVRAAVGEFEEFSRMGEQHYHTFRPFIAENDYVFRSDNTRALFHRMPPVERRRLPWSPETIDWYSYWLDVHIPGLRKWVFPKLEEGKGPQRRRVHTYAHLHELFDTVTKIHAGRVAMRIRRDGREETYTYAELRECALRAAAFLTSEGIEPGDRVGLVAENSPEWGMSYFGIVKAGATCVPIEKEATTDQIVNLLRLSEASGLVLSDTLLDAHPELPVRLASARPAARLWIFSDIFALRDEAIERDRIAALPADTRGDAIASIIFTSGTTGNPKGVMLSHRNFTSLLAKLLTVYELTHEDGMLSILPLHHSFEFTTGFLLPLSRGAQITYLTELNGDRISDALQDGHVTCIVGVPALWDLLKRRILSRLSEQSPYVGQFAEALIDANYLLREETSLNLGPLIFMPVHLALGGKIRYLISGGAALPEETFKTFRGLGFNLNEGYGLTEAAPVLTVTRPGARSIKGSVGQPLPGIEVRIQDPDKRGVGEVIARGPNVMEGYYGNEDATREAVVDGWLHTGDLGRIDQEGNLYIVGRLKEVIVDANGKNVYPEELEEAYAGCEFVKELAVVGLSEDGGERVSCVAVPAYDRDPSLTPAEVRARIEAFFHETSARLPIYKRVKILQLWDGELPRTATRKVKRREVVDLLRRLRRRADEATAAAGAERVEDADFSWLLEVVATIAEKPRAAVRMDTRLDELGFDSLMYTELGVAIEAASGHVLPADALAGLSDLRELTEFLRRTSVRASRRDRGVEVHRADQEGEGDITVPPPVAALGRKVLGAAQHWFYHDVLRPEFRGRANIPMHTHFLVAANHASHLDMGLVKMALGDAGANLVSLAAADYFFDNQVKRTFFENFTNLVPVERKGSLRKSLKTALQLLDQGHTVLIFPEGTRSRSGRIQRFQRGLGHLALHGRVGVLPVYLATYDALPPGTWYPRSYEVAATIGPFLAPELLERLAEGFSRSDAERLVTVLVQSIIEDLQSGVSLDLEQKIGKLRQQAGADDRADRGVAVVTGVAEPKA
jgi:long-chain acyl-CoA synthetase